MLHVCYAGCFGLFKGGVSLLQAENINLCKSYGKQEIINNEHQEPEISLNMYVCFKTALHFSSLRNVILALCHVQNALFLGVSIYPYLNMFKKQACVYLHENLSETRFKKLTLGKKRYYKCTLGRCTFDKEG